MQPILFPMQQRVKAMTSIDLTALNKDYSVYIPSMQIGSARNLMMSSSQWQKTGLPKGLEPADFNYLNPSNKHWHYKYALASADTQSRKL